MTSNTNLQRAAAAFKLAISLTESAARVSGEFPKVGKKLQEAARLAAAEGRRAETEKES